ncbi:hypothetical protein SRABI106_03922 [Rahnella aquatilis]|nr:hypothetical protein SRABI106_03922 [Rahnella aquatilis]
MCRDHIDFRRTDKTGDEQTGRAIIQLNRRANLLNVTFVKHHDPVRQCHGLDLIVGHVNHGVFQTGMELTDFLTHLHTQRGIKVRQRFIKQKNFRLLNNGTPDSDALTLSAGKILR